MEPLLNTELKELIEVREKLLDNVRKTVDGICNYPPQNYPPVWKTEINEFNKWLGYGY